MGRMDGRIVVITGAAGGIGAATARRLVADGAHVVLADLDGAALHHLASELAPSASAAVCDITDADDVARLYTSTLAQTGTIDACVLNAGIEGKIASLGDATLADFDKVMSVNLRGVFIGLSALMPVMRRQGKGSIVILSSTAGLRGSAGLAAYVASKHGVLGLMRTAAIEGGPYGVRVNAVNPGPTDTRMIRAIEAGRGDLSPDDAHARTAASIPLRRHGQPQEIANVIAFLASDEASFCSGGTYLADGALLSG